jgi:DNA-binding response OmpR family regulator
MSTRTRDPGERAGARGSEKPAAAGGWSRKRVLVVDDSQTMRMMVEVMLRRSSYDVVTARDGDEAVAKATANPPDAILMDVMMPKLSGIEACRVLRAEQSTKGVPIILVTTRGEQASIDAGFASGCNDYVTKPVDSRELLEKLRALLNED